MNRDSLPDTEIIALHDAIAAAPLAAVAELRRLAFRARGLAARHPGDLPTLLTTAQGLAKSGQRRDALVYADKAFAARGQIDALRSEIALLCLDLGMMDQARVCIGEAFYRPAPAGRKSHVRFIATSALLIGEMDLIDCIASLGALPETDALLSLAALVERNGFDAYLKDHMRIVAHHAGRHCCVVDVEYGPLSAGGGPEAICIDHRLDLPPPDCRKLHQAMRADLQRFYDSAGCPAPPYADIVTHIFTPMPDRL